MRGRRWMLLLALSATWPGQHAFGWGATGHEWATGIAIEKLPDNIPALVRDPAILPELALMGRELNRVEARWKTHDKERDPGHYVDLTDDGKTMGIRAARQTTGDPAGKRHGAEGRGSTQYKAGYQLHSMLNGWQQIRKDFALPAGRRRGIETATSSEDRA